MHIIIFSSRRVCGPQSDLCTIEVTEIQKLICFLCLLFEVNHITHTISILIEHCITYASLSMEIVGKKIPQQENSQPDGGSVEVRKWSQRGQIRSAGPPPLPELHPSALKDAPAPRPVSPLYQPTSSVLLYKIPQISRHH